MMILLQLRIVLHKLLPNFYVLPSSHSLSLECLLWDMESVILELLYMAAEINDLAPKLSSFQYLQSPEERLPFKTPITTQNTKVYEFYMFMYIICYKLDI